MYVIIVIYEINKVFCLLHFYIYTCFCCRANDTLRSGALWVISAVLFVYEWFQHGVDVEIIGDENTLGFWLDLYARYSQNVKVNVYGFSLSLCTICWLLTQISMFLMWSLWCNVMVQHGLGHARSMWLSFWT